MECTLEPVHTERYLEADERLMMMTTNEDEAMHEDLGTKIWDQADKRVLRSTVQYLHTVIGLLPRLHACVIFIRRIIISRWYQVLTKCCSVEGLQTE